MPKQKCRPLFPLFAIVVCILFRFSVPALAQEVDQPIGDVGATKTNGEAVRKLKEMSPEEIKNLDAFMAQALTLYYDREFAQALPIFKKIADKVETMDIMFWLGTSAAKVGEIDLAIEKFRKMLQIDPNLYRVRLELASVYFSMGRHQEARQELEKVLAADPPSAVKANISRMLSAIDERTRKLSWNLRLVTGFMWDDNISSGPDPGAYILEGGTSFRPSMTSAKLSDEASVSSFTGNLLYDFGETRGLMWNTAASLYSKSYQDYREFDYLAVDLNTGPWWAWRQSILKISAGYTHTEYGSDRLSHIIHMDPSYEYFFSKYFSLRGSYVYKDERFFQKSREDLSGITNILELFPTIYLDNRRHIFTATLGYEKHNTKNDLYTYQAPLLGINYFTRFATKTELYVGYQWSRRNYGYDQGFPYTGLERNDTRHFYTAVLSQALFKYVNLSYAFAYTDNNSNLDLNTWDKTTHTVSIGCRF